MEATNRKPHSAEYFGDTRDYWWNRDFLELMARRWNLAPVRDVLDVGCGVGHWSRALTPVLPPEAVIVGIDREQEWIERCRRHARERVLEHRYRYVQGVAEQLPFEDSRFDLVTCQTVLIHVPNPKQVLAEMLRVLKPGGLLVAVEPNNMANALVFDSVSFDAEPEVLLSMARLQLLCERGKAALGEGNNSVGDLVPRYLAELGASSIDVYLSDKAASVQPPYDTPEQQAFVRELSEWDGRGFWGWGHDETQRYFLAGGGTESEFEMAWAIARGHLRKSVEALTLGTFSSAGGHVSYVVSARKPRPSE